VLILLTTIDSFNSLNQNNLVVLSLFMYIANFRPKLNPCAEKCNLYALGKEGYNYCCFVVALQENTHYVSVYVPVWRPLFLLWTRSRPMKILFYMSWVPIGSKAGREGLEMGGMDKIRFAWYNRKRNERIRKLVCFTRVFFALYLIYFY